MERLAVIADVHGNRWALEAVLADIAHRNVDAIVNLGDCLYGPLDPVGTAEILLDLDLPAVRGNEDRMIVEPSAESAGSPTLRYTREGLSARHRQWLESLPLTRVAFGDFRLCHGTPEEDTEYLLWQVSDSGLEPRREDQLLALTESLGKPVLLCAHDHTPRVIELPSGKLIVNPGSVGLQAYTDDVPIPHAMETGSPHARYAILLGDDGGWRAEIITVPYDWEAAASVAERNVHVDWAHWLRTGRADGDAE